MHTVLVDARKRKRRKTFKYAICLYIKYQHCVGIVKSRTYGVCNRCLIMVM
ncbi:rCG52538 [Rattus norvegicus]|uniref:RCG52538 n=1 Tax=Rattus norvegicus TaxID=10116 RepID=A6IQV4_RAT|nr:rCG52538 [Rattus norvegicus]